jgi:hypothetical protein
MAENSFNWVEMLFLVPAHSGFDETRYVVVVRVMFASPETC